MECPNTCRLTARETNAEEGAGPADLPLPWAKPAEGRPGQLALLQEAKVASEGQQGSWQKIT